MKQFILDIGTVEKVRKFNEIARTYDEDIDIIRGRYTISAKSILGIFSIDITIPVIVRIESNNQDTILQFRNDISDFIIGEKNE